jgi:hypothetical protein
MKKLRKEGRIYWTCREYNVTESTNLCRKLVSGFFMYVCNTLIYFSVILHTRKQTILGDKVVLKFPSLVSV